MAAGDASRTWFSEMVEALRREWKPEMSWEQVVTLRDRLDAMLQEIRSSREIRPPTMWCPVCKQRTQQAEPSVSVRAVIFALGRFGVAPPAEVKSLQKRWAKHRKQNGLDRHGKPSQAVATGFSPQGPARHSHSPTDVTSVDAAPDRKPQQVEPRGERFSRATSERRPR